MPLGARKVTAVSKRNPSTANETKLALVGTATVAEYAHSLFAATSPLLQPVSSCQDASPMSLAILSFQKKLEAMLLWEISQ